MKDCIRCDFYESNEHGYPCDHCKRLIADVDDDFYKVSSMQSNEQTTEIEWYTRHLEKVKLMHNPLNSNRPDLCNMYIKHAEAMLEAVKNGKSPYNL